MNTERTPFRPEDSDGDSNDVVSFGDGKSKPFRPIPPRPREAPAPTVAAEHPAPRLPEGILFQRSASPEKASTESEEDDDSEETPKKSMFGKVVIPPPSTKVPESSHSASDYAEMPKLIRPDAETEQLLNHLGDTEEVTSQPGESALPKDSVHEQQPDTITIDELLKDIESRWPATSAESLPSIHGMEAISSETAENDNTGASSVAVPVKPASSRPSYSTTAASSHNAMPGQASSGSSSPNTSPNQGGNFPPSASGNGNVLTSNQPPGSNSGGMPPTNYNSYPSGASGGGGAGGGGYNPNAMNQWPVTPNQAPEQHITIKKRGSVLPYVAVLAENIARKRADRRLKKELSGRMDEQDRQREANQLRAEQQNQRLADAQRRQSIREAYRPSGHEWGVPKPAPDQEQMKQLAKEVTPEVERAMDQKPQQHVEHSAWHSIVVNEHGQPVDNGMQYGEGYRQERQQEIIQDHTGDTGLVGSTASGASSGNAKIAASSGVVAGGFRDGSLHGGRSGGAYGSGSGGGSFGGGVNSGQYSYDHQLQSGLTTPGLPTGQSTHIDPQHQLPEHAGRQSNAPGPLFWFMLSLIIIAFFVAALI